MSKTVVIYHRADFDGIFCREIARLAMPEAEFIGWDYGDPEPCKDLTPDDALFILDLSVPSLMDHPKLIWIDHHKSAIEKYGIKGGIQMDGVAACRLAWQYFFPPTPGAFIPNKQDFVDRNVTEPYAVQLAGEYDIWDKRNPDAELFQHGLRSRQMTEFCWQRLLTLKPRGMAVPGGILDNLLKAGTAIQFAKTEENKSIIEAYGFTVQFEGLCFLACNHARYNSHLFSAGLRPEHEGCLGFNWTGKDWRVSLYGVPGKPDVDLAAIAVKHGGGGHKQACGFRTEKLPFIGRLAAVTLSVDEIKGVAEFAGLRFEGEITDEDRETEIKITDCPAKGIEDEDGEIIHYRHIAYLEEYPEEGVCPLGRRLSEAGK